MKSSGKKKRIGLGLLAATVMILGSAQAVYAEEGTIKIEGSDATYDTVYAAFDAASNGDTITLTGDTDLFGASEDHVISDKDLTLDLNGYSVDLKGKNIINRGNLTVKNSGSDDAVHYFNASTWTIRTGLSDSQKEIAVDVDNANSIAAAENVKVSGSILYNGGQNNGGLAIQNTNAGGKKATLVVENVAIVGCRLMSIPSVPINGGAIENEGEKVTLKYVRGYGNAADYGGFFYNAGGGTAVLENCAIRFCYAQESGGAILNLGKCDVTDTYIDECNAAKEGGAITNGTGDYTTSTMTVKDCTIENCTQASDKGQGGAIVNNGSFELTNAYIVDCSANGAGAGIFNTGAMNVNQTIIRNCHAQKCGSAIFNDGKETKAGNNAVTTLEDVAIEGCGDPSPEEGNGSIYVRNSNLVMKSGYVENAININNNTEGGNPICDVKIYRGKFKNYTPHELLLADGSNLAETDDPAVKYVVEAVKMDDGDTEIKAGWDKDKTVTWKNKTNADTYVVKVYDKGKNIWDTVATLSVSGNDASYTFKTPGQKEETVTFIVIGYKAGEPVSQSEPIELKWMDPSMVMDERDCKINETAFGILNLGKKDQGYSTEQEFELWVGRRDTVSEKLTKKKNKVSAISLNIKQGVSDNMVTVNAGAKLNIANLKGYTFEKIDTKMSAGASEKVSKKVGKTAEKLSTKTIPNALKKGKNLTLPTIKGVDYYTIAIADQTIGTKVTIKVVSMGFDKKELKGVTLKKDAGVSANQVSANSLPAAEGKCANVKDNIITLATLPGDGRTIGGFWTIGKTPLTKVGVTTAVKSGKVMVNAVVNSDGTLTFALDPQNKAKGSVKITYTLNRKKYKAAVKVTK